MGLYSGATEIVDVQHGSTQIENVYSGATLVWTNETRLFVEDNPILNLDQWQSSLGTTLVADYIRNTQGNTIGNVNDARAASYMPTVIGKTYRVYTTLPIRTSGGVDQLDITLLSDTNQGNGGWIRYNHGDIIDHNVTIVYGTGQSFLSWGAVFTGGSDDWAEIPNMYVEEV